MTPGEVEAAVKKIVEQAPYDKFAVKQIPDKYNEIAAAFAEKNIPAVLNGTDLPDISPELGGKIKKILRRKSQVALKMADNVMAAQIPLSIAEAVEYELGQLNTLFRTADALEGLSSAVEHRKPEFKGNK